MLTATSLLMIIEPIAYNQGLSGCRAICGCYRLMAWEGLGSKAKRERNGGQLMKGEILLFTRKGSSWLLVLQSQIQWLRLMGLEERNRTRVIVVSCRNNRRWCTVDGGGGGMEAVEAKHGEKVRGFH